MPRSCSPMTLPEQSYSPYNKYAHKENGCRIHVADLSRNCTKYEIQKAFNKWGLVEIWHAQASRFAFVVLRHHEDGLQAINELNDRYIGDARVRVSLARPRTRGLSQNHFDPNMRCYQCGCRGHLSRDCGNNKQHFNKHGHEYRSYSYDHRREQSSTRSRSPPPRPRIIREYHRYSTGKVASSSSSHYEFGH